MIKQIRTSRKIIIMMSRQSVKHFFIPSFDLSVWNYNWQLCMQSRCRSIQHNIVKKISKKPTPVKPNVSWGFFQSLLKCVLWLLTWTCVGRRVSKRTHRWPPCLVSMENMIFKPNRFSIPTTFTNVRDRRLCANLQYTDIQNIPLCLPQFSRPVEIHFITD